MRGEVFYSTMNRLIGESMFLSMNFTVLFNPTLPLLEEKDG